MREDVGTWVITLFSMASTVCIPLSGTLSLRYGNFRLFIFGILLFLFASTWCGLAQNFSLLLIGRVLQGCAAGLLTPVSLAMLILNFPEEKRSVAVGLWSFFVMVGPAMGPMIGGWLSDYHWHWMFFLNIPFSIFSVVTVWCCLKDKKDEGSPFTLDIIGIILLFTCVGSLQIAMNRWNIYDWFYSPIIISLFILGFLCLVFFIVWELFHPSPFIHLQFLKNRNFLLPSLTTGVGMGLLFSSFVLDSLWVQRVLGYTPAWAGLTLSPVGIFPLIFYPLIGRFVSLLDLRIWIIGSFFLYASTFFWLSDITVFTPFWQLALPRLVQGIGFAFFTVPNSLLIMQGVQQQRLASAISLFSFLRMVFVGFAVALSITLWIFWQTFYQTRLTACTLVSNSLFTDLLTPFEKLAHSKQKSFDLGYDSIVAHSSTLALADIYYLYGWIFLTLCIVVFCYKSAKP